MGVAGHNIRAGTGASCHDVLQAAGGVVGMRFTQRRSKSGYPIV